MRAALLLAGVLGVTGCGGPGKPNVLLISIDTLRADHLSAWGYRRPTSPRIDRLAREGTRFMRAYSASSWTVPSHMTMFTGLPPSVHGVTDIGLRLDRARVTLAERFQDAGWQTAGFVSGPTLHRAFGFDQGFERYQNTMAFERADFDRGDPTRPSGRSRRRSHHAVTGPTVGRAVRSWIAEEARPPFFLFVHLWDPHYDYIPPPPYDTRFDPLYDGRFDFANVESNVKINADMPARDLRHMIALYDGEIAATDAVIGEIVDALDERTWLDDTLVVVTSDHGEEFFEHGGKGHVRTLFDEVLHVPLLFRLPGVVAAGRRVDAIIDAIHLMPTILGVAGLEAGPEAEGRNLAAVLRGGAPPEGLWAFSELSLQRKMPLYSVRTPDRRYLAAVEQPSPLAMNVVWFDEMADPEEQAAAQATDATSEALIARLRDHVRSMTDTARDLPRVGAGPGGLGARTREQLKALGYLRDE